MAPVRSSSFGAVAQVWGLAGVFALLGNAVFRLAPRALEALSSPLSGLQWCLLVGFAGFMAYAEGYRGFQRQFSPRVVVRSRWLRDNPRPLLVLLAPACCMGLVYASRKRLVVSWTILTMVVGLIVGVRLLAQPWRGIVDCGVIVGLSWGLVAIVGWLLAAARGTPLPVPVDLPEPVAAA